MLELVGWVGNVFLAFCVIPLAVEAYEKGNLENVPPSFLIIWGLGEVFSLAYALPKNVSPIVFNYLINIVGIMVCLRYRVWPRKS